MPPAKRRSVTHAAPLLDSLEQRLDLLTRTLSAADIAEKSIDIVKEIKELHAILRSLRDDAPPETPPRMVVVWGGRPAPHLADCRVHPARQLARHSARQTRQACRNRVSLRSF